MLIDVCVGAPTGIGFILIRLFAPPYLVGSYAGTGTKCIIRVLGLQAHSTSITMRRLYYRHPFEPMIPVLFAIEI